MVRGLAPYTSFPGLHDSDHSDSHHSDSDHSDFDYNEKNHDKPRGSSTDVDFYLINSDPSESNNNLCGYLKLVVDQMMHSLHQNADTDNNDNGGGFHRATSPSSVTETTTLRTSSPPPPSPMKFHELSEHAMRLLTLNLFLKNYKFCIYKLMALLKVLADLTDAVVENDAIASDAPAKGGAESEARSRSPTRIVTASAGSATAASSPSSLSSPPPSPEDLAENDCYLEFITIVLLILLKVKNTAVPGTFSPQQRMLDMIDELDLFVTLEESHFVAITATFVRSQIAAASVFGSQTVLLKFGCDLFFEYLYHKVLLSDSELSMLTHNTTLISTLIDDILSNDSFNHYDLSDDYLEDLDKQRAYEEFKLLLLVNEQFLMKSYSCGDMQNQIFHGLMTDSHGSVTYTHEINSFINLLIFNLNREESEVTKILILKFLYLVFTTSYTSKLFYLNDLKILVDIIIRDLNNVDLASDNANRALAVAYLKVLCPLLMFSQLGEQRVPYKVRAITDVLGHFVINSGDSGSRGGSSGTDGSGDSGSGSGGTSGGGGPDASVISNLALRCLRVPYLKSSDKDTKPKTEKSSGSASPLTGVPTGSTDSLTSELTRMASVRATSRTSFSLPFGETVAWSPSKDRSQRDNHNDMRLENNHNIFLSDTFDSVHTQVTLVLSQLGSISLRKRSTSGGHDARNDPIIPPPVLPRNLSHTVHSSHATIGTHSRGLAKKKRPPPPPPPPRALARRK